jgi:hypothetical protein
MIKSLKAVGLNRRLNFDQEFYEDINIITGKNGSGKTTLLKLLWYAISDNLERIIPEIKFESFELVTDKVRVSMATEPRHKRTLFKLTYQIGDGERKEFERPVERSMRWDELSEANRLISRASGATIFFPTFRRIEGGVLDFLPARGRGRPLHRSGGLDAGAGLPRRRVRGASAGHEPALGGQGTDCS